MAGKSIKTKTYKYNKFEKTRGHLKLNFKYPEYSIGFWWAFHTRCGYKFDVHASKAANMTEDNYPERCPCC